MRVEIQRRYIVKALRYSGFMFTMMIGSAFSSYGLPDEDDRSTAPLAVHTIGIGGHTAAPNDSVLAIQGVSKEGFSPPHQGSHSQYSTISSTTDEEVGSINQKDNLPVDLSGIELKEVPFSGQNCDEQCPSVESKAEIPDSIRYFLLESSRGTRYRKGWFDRKTLGIPRWFIIGFFPAYGAQSLTQKLFFFQMRKAKIGWLVSKSVAITTATLDTPATASQMRRFYTDMIHKRSSSITHSIRNSVAKRFVHFLVPSSYREKFEDDYNRPWIRNCIYYGILVTSTLTAAVPVYILYNVAEEDIKVNNEPSSYRWAHLPFIPFLFQKYFFSLWESGSKVANKFVFPRMIIDTPETKRGRKTLLNPLKSILDFVEGRSEADTLDREDIINRVYKASYDPDSLAEATPDIENDLKSLLAIYKIFATLFDGAIRTCSPQNQSGISKLLTGQIGTPISRRIVSSIGSYAGPAASAANFMIGMYVGRQVLLYFNPSTDIHSPNAQFLQYALGSLNAASRGLIETFATRAGLLSLYDYLANKFYDPRENTSAPTLRKSTEVFSFLFSVWQSFPMMVVGFLALSELPLPLQIVLMLPYLSGETGVASQRLSAENQNVGTYLVSNNYMNNCFGGEDGIDPQGIKRDRVVKYLLRKIRRLENSGSLVISELEDYLKKNEAFQGSTV